MTFSSRFTPDHFKALSGNFDPRDPDYKHPDFHLDPAARALVQLVTETAGGMTDDLFEAIITKRSECGHLLDADMAADLLKSHLGSQKASLVDLINCKLDKLGEETTSTHQFEIDVITTVELPPPRRHRTPAPPVRRVRRDPIHFLFEQSPKTNFLFVWNTAELDDKGAPRLMKVVHREGANLDTLMAKFGEYLESMNCLPVSEADLTDKDREKILAAIKQDVDVIEADAMRVRATETDEGTFQHGTPVRIGGADNDGNFLSMYTLATPHNVATTRTVQQGRLIRALQTEAADQTGPQINGDKVYMNLKVDVDHPDPGVRAAQRAAGLGIARPHVRVEFGAHNGLVREPSSQAEIKAGLSQDGMATFVPLVCGASITTSGPIEPRRVHLTGKNLEEMATKNKIQVHAVTLDPAGEPKADQRIADLNFFRLIERHADEIHVGGRTLAQASEEGGFSDAGIELDRNAAAAAGIEIDANQPEKKGAHYCDDGDDQYLNLTIPPSFVSSLGEGSVEGWQLQVGFVDHTGKWTEADGVQTCSNKKGEKQLGDDWRTLKGRHSKEEKFSLRVQDDTFWQNSGAGGRPPFVEIRLRNENNVQVAKFKINMDQWSWAPEELHPVTQLQLQIKPAEAALTDVLTAATAAGKQVAAEPKKDTQIAHMLNRGGEYSFTYNGQEYVLTKSEESGNFVTKRVSDGAIIRDDEAAVRFSCDDVPAGYVAVNGLHGSNALYIGGGSTQKDFSVREYAAAIPLEDPEVKDQAEARRAILEEKAPNKRWPGYEGPTGKTYDSLPEIRKYIDDLKAQQAKADEEAKCAANDAAQQTDQKDQKGAA